MYEMDVNQADFDEKVVKASFTQPVVIDFWAPWCAPCKSLKPILEKLAGEYAGKFLLAKVNSDENPEVSARYAVRGIPAVKAMRDGRIVDEFTGALPEGEVRAWLEGVIPSPAESLRGSARQLADTGDLAGALRLLGDAAKLDPANEWVRVDAAEILLSVREVAEAQRLLESLKSQDILKDDRVLQLFARVKFAQMGAQAEDEAALAASVATNGDDLESRLKLANLRIAAGRHQEGMDELLEIVRRDRSFRDDIARKTLLDVFSLLGGSELLPVYRRKLASLLN